MTRTNTAPKPKPDPTAAERQAIWTARRKGNNDALSEYLTARLTVWIRRELEKAPPLSEEQRARLRALFAPGREELDDAG